MSRQLFEKIDATKEFINFSERLLIEEPKIESMYELYNFEKEEITSVLFSEVEFEVLNKLKEKLESNLKNNDFKFVIYRYKDLNELRIYYNDEYVGIVDLKHKEIVMFKTKEELDYVQKKNEESKSVAIKNLKKEIETLEKKQTKISYKFKKVLRKTYELDNKLNLKKAYLMEAEDETPRMYESYKKFLSQMEDFLSLIKNWGFSVFGDNDLSSFQIFRVFDGIEHLTYLKQFNHYGFRNLFETPFDNNKNFILTRDDYINPNHGDHCRHILSLPNRLLNVFSNDNFELINLEIDFDYNEDVKDEEELFCNLKKKGSFIRVGDFGIKSISFRYKKYIYMMKWNGLVISTREAQEMLLNELQKEKEEIDRYIDDIINGMRLV